MCCSAGEGVEKLVVTHRARLVRVARHEGVMGEDALDCAQEAFETFLQRADAQTLCDDEDASGKLLTTMVRNAARNRRRRHHLARPHTSDAAVVDLISAPTPSSETLLIEAESTERLHLCVATLGELQRRAVTLRLLEERDGEDVALLLGITRNHMSVLLMRARAALRSCMLRSAAEA